MERSRWKQSNEQKKQPAIATAPARDKNQGTRTFSTQARFGFLHGKALERVLSPCCPSRQIVQDFEGGYFRIFQPTSIGSQKGTYLNMVGNELRPARFGKNGIQTPLLRDVDKGMWQQETHFFIDELLP